MVVHRCKNLTLTLSWNRNKQIKSSFTSCRPCGVSSTELKSYLIQQEQSMLDFNASYLFIYNYIMFLRSLKTLRIKHIYRKINKIANQLSKGAVYLDNILL